MEGKKTLKGSIRDEDREWIGGDSRRFLERALLRAETWEEGLKYAKELRAMQHPTLSAIATKAEQVDVLELRWTTHRDGIPSNELLERQQTTRRDEVESNEVGRDYREGSNEVVVGKAENGEQGEADSTGGISFEGRDGWKEEEVS